MSTNYYAKWPDYPSGLEGLHIGKSSYGWEFLFRAHPGLELTTAAAWHRFLGHPWVDIVTEDGTAVELDEFWAQVVSRSEVGAPRVDNEFEESATQWRDPSGARFAAYEFC
jgi:hypothetical protein